MRKPIQTDLAKGPVKCRFKHATSNVWTDGMLRAIDSDRTAKLRYFVQSTSSGKTGWSVEAEIEDVQHEESECKCSICMAEKRLTGFLDDSLDVGEQSEVLGRQVERLCRTHIDIAPSIASCLQTHIILGVADGTLERCKDAD